MWPSAYTFEFFLVVVVLGSMIRRRLHPGVLNSREVPNVYEKGRKIGGRISLLRLSLGAIAAIFVLFLLMLVDHLDSIASIKPNFGPGKDLTSQNIHFSDNSKPMKTHAIHSSSTKRTNIGEIPYIRYNETLSVNDIKERMDYAISHGDAENPNNPNNTMGQLLLDFGIVGFPKCGTTTMMKWLNMHNQIAVLGREIMSLQVHHPANILRWVVKSLPEGRYRRGYKSPNDISHGRARNKLGIHYPKTRLLVGLRHPVLWFESFYNHRVQNGMAMPDLEEILSKKGPRYKYRCDGIWNGACFGRANFHFTLAEWGKTPLLSLGTRNEGYASYYNADYNRDDEWKFFSKDERNILEKAVNKTRISPNPMFLYDVSQLHISRGKAKEGDDEQRKRNRYEAFVLSLQEFLGVPKNVSAMPPMIRESPGRTDINATEQERRQSLKINICDDKYALARTWLLEHGTNMAGWTKDYLSKSPHGVYFGGGIASDGSSQFLEIIASYSKDPCEERES